MTRVLEGIWEEVASHAKELSGQRVRLIVLDPQTSIDNTQEMPKTTAAMRECLTRMQEAHGHSQGRKWARDELYSDESLH